MSQVLINKYLTDLANLKKVSGTHRESVVREAFKDLLKAWGKSLDLTFIPEHEVTTRAKERRYVDGALLHTLRVPFGYWEAKDSSDDLDVEIEKKFRAGYPKTNIVFEDSTQAVLYQHGVEVKRCGVEDVKALEKLLTLFFTYERPEIEAFREAVVQFKEDLPAVLEALRSMIEASYSKEPTFREAASGFLKHAQDAINPSLVDADVREMLIQHILTGEVFGAVFPNTNYHENNSVSRELHKLEATFFSGDTKFKTLKALAPYYTAIRKAAADIETHHEKQNFLKAIYEDFYKVYNPKAADRLGVIYTPNEIVRFLIESADYLCEKHFGRTLIDEDVDILDPATGTGTFICELLEHFAGQKAKLVHKYRTELHANEVAILPYYVANLNIEATYAAITEGYEEFPGLCFVDTLDNTYALRKHKGHMDDFFGSVSGDNVKRIRQQNSRRISVIIGNPPYNANQLNENENNKNREYSEIDKRIKETYIAKSTAQKTKLYDMYARFFRWASDRLDENGILAFITNRSFIESRTFDGFRACVGNEFSEIRIVDLGGDVRTNPKLSGTVHNVFGIQTGVAISLMVRRAKQKGCRIYYSRRPEMEKAEDKLLCLANSRIGDISFEEIAPDARSNWLNITNNDFDALALLASDDVRSTTRPNLERAMFKSFSLGISTNRDEWLYNVSVEALSSTAKYLVEHFNTQDPSIAYDESIKWSEALKLRFKGGKRSAPFGRKDIRVATYRPFCKENLFDSALFIDRRSGLDEFYPHGESEPNPSICMIGVATPKPFSVFASDLPVDLHVLGAGSGATYVALYRYVEGVRVENITNWALDRFRKHYGMKGERKSVAISKDAIFHYIYGVFHDPLYREKYLHNLKRDLPRVPFYGDTTATFFCWAEWGRRLLSAHIGYEGADPWPLCRRDEVDDRARATGNAPRCILRADPVAGRILIDDETTLDGIPRQAWDYRLGNRCGLEWILDQHKEKTPKDPTIREKFNTYRFADYKEEVIDLLKRVTTVSVETVKIVEEMRRARR